MKNNFTTLLKFFSFIFFLFGGVALNAQAPANDKCENAELIGIAVDQASCVQTAGDTRMTENATQVPGTPSVCSGSWYTDDVWYKVEIGNDIPTNGIIVETEFGSQTDDVMEIGMAFYRSCDASEDPIQCYSNEPGRNTLTIPPSCLAANEDFIIRVWSAGSPTDNSGTFRICSYENPEAIPVEDEVVYYEEDFATGYNGWTQQTLQGLNTTPADTLAIWQWRENAIFETWTGGAAFSISNPFSSCTPAVGFAAGFNQNNGGIPNPDSLGTVAPAAYEEFVAEFISPVLDLSGINTGLSLKFDQVFQRLNANTGGAPIASIQFTIDGGSNWSDPIEVNGDMEANDPVRDNIVKVPLPGVEGQSNVQVKFVFQGDFYIWIVDRVQIVEADRNEIVALRSAAGNNAWTPKSQIYPVSFLIDVGNDGLNPAENIVATAKVFDLTNGGVEVFTEDKDIPTIPPFNFMDDSDVAFDNIWASRYTPPAVEGDYEIQYSITYDSIQTNVTDDSLRTVFSISDTTFRKEFMDPDPNGNLDGILPADADWTYGAGYYVPNGDGWACSGITFAISNTDNAQFIGSTIGISLYRWDDVNGDGDATADERGFGSPTLGGELLGNFTYTIDGTEINENIDIFVQLDNLAGANETDPILLEDDAQYIVAIEMTSPTGVTAPLAIVADNDINYLNSWFVNDSLANIDPVNYAPQHGAFFSNETGFTADLAQDFGFSPHIHMHITDDIVSNKNVLAPENKIEVFPNPANDVINLDLDMVSTFDKIGVKVTDVTGKTMFQIDYENIWKERYTYDVSDYSAGTYFIHVRTDEGNRVVRFVVAK